jgi:hypothetical protein
MARLSVAGVLDDNDAEDVDDSDDDDDALVNDEVDNVSADGEQGNKFRS